VISLNLLINFGKNGYLIDMESPNEEYGDPVCLGLKFQSHFIVLRAQI
jgi:hypothetical protein